MLRNITYCFSHKYKFKVTVFISLFIFHKIIKKSRTVFTFIYSTDIDDIIIKIILAIFLSESVSAYLRWYIYPNSTYFIWYIFIVEYRMNKIFLLICKENKSISRTKHLLIHIKMYKWFLMCCWNKDCFILNSYYTLNCCIIKISYYNDSFIFILMFIYIFNKLRTIRSHMFYPSVRKFYRCIRIRKHLRIKC